MKNELEIHLKKTKHLEKVNKFKNWGNIRQYCLKSTEFKIVFGVKFDFWSPWAKLRKNHVSLWEYKICLRCFNYNTRISMIKFDLFAARIISKYEFLLRVALPLMVDFVLLFRFSVADIQPVF